MCVFVLQTKNKRWMNVEFYFGWNKASKIKITRTTFCHNVHTAYYIYSWVCTHHKLVHHMIIRQSLLSLNFQLNGGWHQAWWVRQLAAVIYDWFQHQTCPHQDAHYQYQSLTVMCMSGKLSMAKLVMLDFSTHIISIVTKISMEISR